MADDVHRVGEEVIREVLEADEMQMLVEERHKQVEGLPVTMIDLIAMLFRADQRLRHMYYFFCDWMATMLFNPSSTYSYVSVSFSWD